MNILSTTKAIVLAAFTCIVILSIYNKVYAGEPTFTFENYYLEDGTTGQRYQTHPGVETYYFSDGTIVHSTNVGGGFRQYSSSDGRTGQGYRQPNLIESIDIDITDRW